MSRPGVDARSGTLPAGFFDGLASHYDAEFSDRLCGGWLRQRVHDCSDPFIPAGASILEIGCGTGADAVYFAARGCEVTATDASSDMLAVAQTKAAKSPDAPRIRCLEWDANASVPAELAAARAFDVAFSNFGALNCISIDAAFVDRLAPLVKPGGWLIGVVMGPYCPWEWLWYGVRGDPGTAFRRLKNRTRAQNGRQTDHTNGPARRTVTYPSAADLAAVLEPAFELRGRFGIGILLPPSYAFHLVDRWPRFFAALAKLERPLAPIWPFVHLNDHYLIVLQKRA